MRLRFGPHRAELAQQVLLRDPHYVAAVLADQPGGVLADVFRELITRFDARPLACPCARCGRKADGVCAYPGSAAVIGFCERCAILSSTAAPASATRVSAYDDALRHVVSSFPRGHRIHMRRIVRGLVLAKGGPSQTTEAAARVFLAL